MGKQNRAIIICSDVAQQTEQHCHLAVILFVAIMKTANLVEDQQPRITRKYVQLIQSGHADIIRPQQYRHFGLGAEKFQVAIQAFDHFPVLTLLFQAAHDEMGTSLQYRQQIFGCQEDEFTSLGWSR
jgi:hypothetical protein